MKHVASPHADLVELLRHSDEPSDTDRERVRVALAAALAPAALVTGTAVVSKGVTLPWYKAGLSKLLFRLGSAGVVTGGAVALLVGFSQEAPAPRPLAPSAWVEHGPVVPINQAPETALSSFPPPGLSIDALPREAPRTVKARPTGAGSSDLEAELRLMGLVQRSLASGQPSAALSLLAEHRERFPGGTLVLERRGLEPVALCQSGRVEEGRKAAQSYLKVAPNSVLGKRIRVACGIEDK